MASKSMDKPTAWLSLGSGFFAILFAWSASFQLDDPDWYFWLPLYTLAFVVCLANTVRYTCISRLLAYFDYLCGMLLFIKVVSKACIKDTGFSWTEFASLDMKQSLVREKFGSWLVCMAMWLELEISGGAFDRPLAGQSGFLVHAGMLLLVSTSIALCATYFLGKKETIGKALAAEL